MALLWNPGGFLTKSREISEPKSVEGLRMRVSDPLFGLMLKHVGASFVTMPSNEISAAMQSGSLDGVVTTYETILSRKIFEQAKFATVGSPALFMGFSPLIMSLSTWRRLTPEQQAAVEEAAAISDAYYAWAQRDVEQRMVTAVRKAGVSVRRMTKQEYLAWLQVAQQTSVAGVHEDRSSRSGTARRAGGQYHAERRRSELAADKLTSVASPPGRLKFSEARLTELLHRNRRSSPRSARVMT